MKFLKLLPFESKLNSDKLDVGLWQRENSDLDICEFWNDKEVGVCDTSGLYYGTSDENEPKFCARHFYLLVVNGNGDTNYKLSK